MNAKATLLILIAGALVGPGGSEAVHPDLDPFWLPGDRWFVDFDTIVEDGSKPPEELPILATGSAREFAPRVAPELSADVSRTHTIHTVRYSYTVQSVGVEDDRDTVNIVVEPVSARADAVRWRMVFDDETRTLLRVEDTAGRAQASENPFFDDSFMAPLGRFDLALIHDFPAFPGHDSDVKRLVEPMGARSSNSFTQTVEFTTEGVTVRMTRSGVDMFDSFETGDHVTTIHWRRGDPWWSTAEVTVGGEFHVAGRLVDVLVPESSELDTDTELNTELESGLDSGFDTGFDSELGPN